MKRLVAVTVVLVFVGLVSPVRAAEDPAGNWKMETNFGGKTRESTLKLKLDGDKLTGVYVGGQNNTETPIENGSFKDGKVSFSVTREFNDTKFVTKYAAKVDGDTIKGTATSDFGGKEQKREFEGKRVKVKD